MMLRNVKLTPAEIQLGDVIEVDGVTFTVWEYCEFRKSSFGRKYRTSEWEFSDRGSIKVTVRPNSWILVVKALVLPYRYLPR